jgi:hypothetical protein
MTPEERFEQIERDLANTAAINAKTAQLAHETQQLLRDFINESREGRRMLEANMNALITESREGRKTLEATMTAFLEAMMGRKNGKK